MKAIKMNSKLTLWLLPDCLISIHQRRFKPLLSADLFELEWTVPGLLNSGHFVEHLVWSSSGYQVYIFTRRTFYLFNLTGYSGQLFFSLMEAFFLS